MIALSQQVLSVGVDVMGSDNAPSVLIDTLARLRLPPGVELVLIGTSAFAQNSSMKFVVAEDVIGHEENPITAIRKKRKSTICVGMRLLKEGKIAAFVSAGNTGALVIAAKTILSTIPGILRPALIALMPTKKDSLAVLDVGANVVVKAAHLVQFAKIGTAFQKARGLETPRVGILNIGSEALKGTSELRIAYKELQASKQIQFVGNIEGKNVFDGDVDVLVTDGFTGNVFLKTAEGIASLILDRLHTQKEAAEKLFDLQRHLHYAEYPGALLAGVRGIVIKCHGYSSPKAFANGVLGAIDLANKNFIHLLQANI